MSFSMGPASMLPSAATAWAGAMPASTGAPRKVRGDPARRAPPPRVGPSALGHRSTPGRQVATQSRREENVRLAPPSVRACSPRRARPMDNGKPAVQSARACAATGVAAARACRPRPAAMGRSRRRAISRGSGRTSGCPAFLRASMVLAVERASPTQRSVSSSSRRSATHQGTGRTRIRPVPRCAMAAVVWPARQGASNAMPSNHRPAMRKGRGKTTGRHASSSATLGLAPAFVSRKPCSAMDFSRRSATTRVPGRTWPRHARSSATGARAPGPASQAQSSALGRSHRSAVPLALGRTWEWRARRARCACLALAPAPR